MTQRTVKQRTPHLSTAQLNAALAHEVPREYRAGYSPLLTSNVTGVGRIPGRRIAAGGLNNAVVYNRVATGLAQRMFVDCETGALR